MSRLLRAELITLRTTRTFYALALAAIGISALITVLVASLTEPSRKDVVQDVFNSDVSSIFICILAIVGITGEWRHRTIASSLLAAPHRVRFLGAKTVAFAAAGVLLSVAIMVATGIVGLAILEGRDLPTPQLGDWAEQLGRNALLAALLGAFGIGLGAVIRNQPTAIVLILVLGFVIEPTLASLAPAVERFGPTGGLAGAIQALDPEDVGGDVDFLPQGLAVLAMLAWIGTLFAAGAALLQLRDVD
jgi:ABC-2 type transport system permease protein